MRSRVLLLAAASLAAALYFGLSSTARAGYGSATAYQVEISANPPGEGIWFWGALDTGGGGGDYQETDCVHLPQIGLVGAAHDGGEVEDWWIDNATNTLHIDGVLLVGGLETANLLVPLPTGTLGHTTGTIEVDFAGGIPIITGPIGRAQIQIAP